MADTHPTPSFADSLQASRLDPEAMTRLLPLIYEHARDIAREVLDGDRAQRWIDASSLVQRTMIRLIDQQKVDLEDTHRLNGVLANTMRRIVVDIARRETAEKRGGSALCVSLQALPEGIHATDSSGLPTVLDIEDALNALARVDREASNVAEMRLWGGMDLVAVSHVTGHSYATARAIWNRAKAWLAAELSGGHV